MALPVTRTPISGYLKVSIVTIIPSRLTTMGEWVQVGCGKGASELAQNMVKGVDHVLRIGWGDVMEE